MTTLRTTVLCIFTLLTISLAAKKYSIPTNRDDITATLTTISQAKMTAILKNIAHLPSLEEFTKHYMLVDVIIKNNSTKTIVLERDDYLENSEHFIASKDAIVMLYSEEIFVRSFFSIVALVVGTIFGVLTIEESIKGVRNGWQNDNEAIGGCILTTVCGLLSGFTLKALKNLQKRLGTTFHTAKHSKGKIKLLYKPTTTTFRIPPGHTFRDKLLIDLSKFSRTFFLNDFSTSLLYEES